MMPLVFLAACGASALAWIGASDLLPWWGTLITTCLWAGGLFGRSRPLLIMGITATVGSCAVVAASGSTVQALFVVGIALWAWDLGWLGTIGGSAVPCTWRVWSLAARVSAAVVAGAVAMAGVFSLLELKLGFWWLLLMVVAMWFLASRLVGYTHRPTDPSGTRR